MKNALTILTFFVAVSATAQTVDSTKAKPANSLSKYQQPSRFEVKPAPNQAPAVQPNLVKKIDEKRVNSSYQYENGRVVGGKTTLQLGKKKN
ncbi:hypothetical protein [Spirosoma areae]